MSHVYGESWQQFEERMLLERTQRNAVAAQREQDRQNRVIPTKQPSLRCCYNCMYSEEAEYEGTLNCRFPLVDTGVEPTDMCAYIVMKEVKL